jgi:RNA polymerase sigma-70 factor (ECF subfamily)
MATPSQQVQPAASTIDTKLMARVTKGDSKAFGQLYDQSSALLYSLAVRILGNREDAVDLLQEVYLEVWRKIVRYDVGRGTPIAWLITLTRSRAIDRLRVHGARAGRPAGGASSSQATDQYPALLESHADQELRGLVSGALTDIPQPQRQAIELAYYDGLSHAEIAAQLNEPLDAVKTRIKLGMSKLWDSLHRYWDQTGS